LLREALTRLHRPGVAACCGNGPLRSPRGSFRDRSCASAASLRDLPVRLASGVASPSVNALACGAGEPWARYVARPDANLWSRPTPLARLEVRLVAALGQGRYRDRGRGAPSWEDARLRQCRIGQGHA